MLYVMDWAVGLTDPAATVKGIDSAVQVGGSGRRKRSSRVCFETKTWNLFLQT
jgi:hypothetical protein